ncbi:MAG: sigma 54-interacting transcriptional regulator [Myxococcota bacterium]
MIKLEIIEGEQSGECFKSDEAVFTIGRLDNNDFSLSDYHISSEHAQVFWEDNQYIFKDLRSTNGSVIKRGEDLFTVNGAHQWELPLQKGDRLLLGAPHTPVIIECKEVTSPSFVDESDKKTKVVLARDKSQLETYQEKALDDHNLARIMYRMVQTIGKSGLRLSDVLDNVAKAVFELIKLSTNVSIYLKNRSNRFKLKYSCSRQGKEQSSGSRSIIRLVLKRKQAVVVADAPEILSDSESILAADIKSVIAVPFWHKGEISGILQCDNRGSNGIFTEKELELLTLLSYQANLAIQNARYFEQLEKKEKQVESENYYLKKSRNFCTFNDIIGESDEMHRIFEQLKKVLDTRVSIHIWGETGTGKELIASAIHNQSKRTNKMFVAQNCAALPENLLESELFGHEKGAFTGADRKKKGLFEISDGGTLFLDEIADMSPSLQVKLLRVLQEGEIRPVGATQVKYVDVRIISATHKNLEKEVEKNNFREDLFYRLHVFPIKLPPLRDRQGDIEILTRHFLEKFNRELKKNVSISKGALEEMRGYKWKGNIRELENEVQRLVILADSEDIIKVEDLRAHQRKQTSVMGRKMYDKSKTLKEMVEEVEKIIIRQAIKDSGGNKTNAAKNLGITREGLYKKISRFNMEL